jgi:hypothetical protein
LTTLCGTALLLGAPARAADEPASAATYRSVAELVKDLPNRRGAVIKLNPKKLTASEAKFYGCAFRDKKKWLTFSLTDETGASLTAYQARSSASALWQESDKDRSANLMYAVLKTPAAKARCKITQFELLSY